MTNQNGGFDWDAPVDPKEAPKPLLPEGPAMFTVLGVKRAREQFGKVEKGGGVQNVAKIKMLVVSDVDQSEAEMEENIWLVLNLKWKFIAFFTAIGQRKHGDEGPFVPDWAKVEGSTGRVEINHRPYTKKDGTTATVNNIKAFVASEESDDVSFP